MLEHRMQHLLLKIHRPAPPLLQGQAESYLERLHKMVENDLNEFIDGAMKVDAWAKWRENLIGLTDVTRSHFEKLVMEL